MELVLTGLGDRRLDRVFNRLLERVEQRITLTIRRLGGKRREEAQFGRFLRNPHFTFKDMLESAIQPMQARCANRAVLLVEDTTELSFGYEPFQTGLASVGNGTESGFYLHPVIALDAEDDLCLGVAALEVFKRQDGPKQPRQQVPLDERPSVRWLRSAQAAQVACAGARRHTVVTDREGDTYYVLTGYQASGLDFVVRCWHDRRLPAPGVEATTLRQQLDTWSVAASDRVKLPRTDKRSAHEALLQVKFGAVTLPRPLPNRHTMRHLPLTLPLYLVEVREDPETVVNHEAPVHWILLTSHRVETPDDARQIIAYYARRWSIEQVFRLLKQQGLQLAESQLHTFESLTKLAVLGLLAAVRIFQLVTAREHATAPITLAFDAPEIQVLEALSPTLEGDTPPQKNPFPKHTLAFAAWVIARLGGWKGYKSERPPGPITMFHGLQQLQPYVEAFALFSRLKDT